MFNAFRENTFGTVPLNIEKFGSNKLRAANLNFRKKHKGKLAKKQKIGCLKPILFNALRENTFGIVPRDIEKFGGNQLRAANLNFRKKRKGKLAKKRKIGC